MKDKMIAMALLMLVLFSGCHAEASEPVPTEASMMELVIIEEPVVEEPVPEPAIEETIYIYDVPLDADLQLHIIETCKAYNIEPSVVVAMIERESTFRADVIGDSGKSYGLMQIQARWHKDRMERLGVSDLLNPYQNVVVGIDYLAELCERYECVGMALMAYNAGPSGAKTYYWDKGVFESKYSTGVLERSEELAERMIEYVKNS